MPVPERGWGDEPVRVCDECARKYEAVNKVLLTQNSLDLKYVLQNVTNSVRICKGELLETSAYFESRAKS